MPGRLQFALQLDPQHAGDRAPDEVFAGLAAEVRAAAEAGFDAFSMGQHYALREFQRIAAMPGLARLAADAGPIPARRPCEGDGRCGHPEAPRCDEDHNSGVTPIIVPFTSPP